MIDLLYRIENPQENIRSILSELRQIIKDADAFGEVYAHVDEHFDLYLQFLHHEDAKTRKNCALLLGDLGMEDAKDSLFQAYQQEEQLFVKSSYLNALQKLDYQSFLPTLQDRLLLLSSTEHSEDEKKHIAEEIRVLNQMIIAYEGINTHIFQGYRHPHDCILTTNKKYKELTIDAITDGDCIPFQGGVRVKTNNLYSILELRTFQELLFVVPHCGTCPSDPELAATALAKSSLLEMIKADHKGSLPFHFRIELKSKLPLDKKANFAKKLASALELSTNRALINSPGDYEFEIRLIQNKDGNYNVLIKYMTIPDPRFDYRVEHVSSSIKPYQAAILVALAKDYMVADAQVLDPFCGVATMLIERQKVVKGNTSYGIDTSADAIEKAKINTCAAGQIIHFVNKNALQFTHEYKFHEIFTNMPWAIGKTTQKDIDLLYHNFFAHAKTLLFPKATIIMHTHDYELSKQCAKENGFTLKKEFSISDKENTYLMIFQTN